VGEDHGVVDPAEVLQPDRKRRRGGRRSGRRRGRRRRRRGGRRRRRRGGRRRRRRRRRRRSGRRSGDVASPVSPSDDLDVPEEPRPLVPEHALELVGDVLRVLVVRGDPRADEAERRRELVLFEKRKIRFPPCFLRFFSSSSSSFPFSFSFLSFPPSFLLLTRMSTRTLLPSLLNSSEAA